MLFVLGVLALRYGENDESLHLGLGGLVGGAVVERADLVAAGDDVLVLGFSCARVEHLLDGHDDGAHYLAQVVIAVGVAVRLALACR